MARGLWVQQHQYNIEEGHPMTYVGIDVAKDKHDCYIVNSDGEILADLFAFAACQSVRG